jgi:hypothetical protein
MNIEKLTIDKNIEIDIKNMVIKTSEIIDDNEEITISINDRFVLDSTYIASIYKNTIELVSFVDLNEKDEIVVVYNKV